MPWPLSTRRRAMGAIVALPVTLGVLACKDATAGDGAGDGAGAAVSVGLAAAGGGPGVVDNTPALRAALVRLTERGGGVLEVGAGVHRFASASLGQGGIALPSGITIRGAGPGRTILQITGTAACNLFVAVDRGRIAIETLSIIGNSVASGIGGYGTGAAIRWILGKTATAGVTGFTMRDVHLENFAGPYWVDIENDARPDLMLAMERVVLERVTFTSRPSNSTAPDDVRLNAAAVCINGYSGGIRGVRVTALAGDARHIKTGIILYHQISDAILEAVAIRAAGIAGATDDAGGYAIQLYDSAYRMTSVTVSNPVVEAPRSVGIYVAGGTGIAIVNPTVSGQTDTRAGTLPKGAIVFNGTRDWQLIGGRLHDNWRDLDIVAAPGVTRGRVTGVRADGSSEGIAIRYLAGQVSSGLTIRDCRWRTSARCVSVQNSAAPVVAGPAATGGRIDDVAFENCHLEAGAGFRAIDLWVDSGSAATGYVVSRCVLVGSNPLFARNQTGSLRVEGCTIRELGTTAGASAAALTGCPRLALRDCTLRSPGPGGIGIDLAGSAGSVRGLAFVDCARTLPPAPLPVQLGRAMPDFAGGRGQYVQNLDPAGGEDAGWVCAGGTFWKMTKKSRPISSRNGKDAAPPFSTGTP